MVRCLNITVSNVGSGVVGPFNLHCVDGSGNTIYPGFDLGITLAQLIAGYQSCLVPDTCTKVRFVDLGSRCADITVDIPLCDFDFDVNISTTTTSTTTASICKCYEIIDLGTCTIDYITCNGDVVTGAKPNPGDVICAIEGSVVLSGSPCVVPGDGFIPTGTLCAYSEPDKDFICLPPTVCYTALAPGNILFITLEWTDPDNIPQSQYIPSFESYGMHFGPVCAQEGTFVVTGGSSGDVTVVGGTDDCTIDGDCPPVCMCYQINNLEGGCTIDYIACDGTVVTEYALSDTIICAQVGSVGMTRGPICEPGLYTPLGTSCITDAGCQCNCIEISSLELSAYEYRDCDNVRHASIVSFGSPINVCGNIDSVVPFIGTSYGLTGNECIMGRSTWECPSLCNCITFVNTCLDCAPITYSYVDCNGDPVVDEPIANGETIEICGSDPTTSDSGNVNIFAGGACEYVGFGYICTTTTTIA